VPVSRRRARRTALAGLAVAAALLLRWAAYLAEQLPDDHLAHHWREAWVGLDVAIAACLAAAVWWGRSRHPATTQITTAAAVLLLCDAWFDVALDGVGPGRWASLALALGVEVPAAALLLGLRPVLVGMAPPTLVDPRHVEPVYADPDCQRVCRVLDEEGPATAQVIAWAEGLPVVAVEEMLGWLRDAGAARRRADGRWERLPQDLRWPEPDEVEWDDAADRARYQGWLDLKYRREVLLAQRAVEQRESFGARAAGARSSAWLTPAELVAFEREFTRLVERHVRRVGRRPRPGAGRTALRFYAVPHRVLDEVDAELVAGLDLSQR